MTIKPEEFRTVLASYATGIALATAAPREGGRVGLTINSFTSVSLEPALVLFCLEKNAQSHQAMQAAGHFAINILAEGQEEISRRFARRGQDAQRWEGLEFERWMSGAPILSTALASLDCELTASHDGGDHSIMVGRVLQIRRRPGLPLLYWSSTYQQLKHG